VEILDTVHSMPNTLHPSFRERWTSLEQGAVLDEVWDKKAWLTWWMGSAPWWEFANEEAEAASTFPLGPFRRNHDPACRVLRF
jgi:hypothetical protein